MASHVNPPNMLTLSSAGLAVFGSLNVLLRANEGGLYVATIAVTLCLILDRLDGPLARKMGISSPMGAQLDSLADMLAFGLQPSLILAMTMHRAQLPLAWIFASAIVYACCALWRLARFHDDGLVESRFGPAFVGIPSPVAGVAALVFMTGVELLQLPAWILPLVLLSLGYLMVSPVRYPKYGIGAWPWGILGFSVLVYCLWRLLAAA